jgi:hypothetical protein
MNNKNQKSQKKQEQKPGAQSTTPVKPVELSDEELGQVVGGIAWGGPTKPTPNPIDINPDPTAVE